jgi:hypothetical protein
MGLGTLFTFGQKTARDQFVNRRFSWSLDSLTWVRTGLAVGRQYQPNMIPSYPS